MSERDVQIGVSVIMPVLNAERTIRTAIESVRSQTFQDWELLVIDNGSTDSTKSIVQEACRFDARISLLTCHSAGAAHARNWGIQRASKPFLSFLDGDDSWRPQFLTKAMEALDKQDADIFSGSYRVRTREGSLVRVRRPPRRVTKSSFVTGNPFGILATVVNRRRNPGFSFPTGRKEDMRAWFQLVKKPGFSCVTSPEVVADYTIQSRRQHVRRKAALLGAHFRFYRYDMGMDVVRSVLATAVHLAVRVVDYFAPASLAR